MDAMPKVTPDGEAERSPEASAVAPVEQIVAITMHGDHVVIRPTGLLDATRTRVFVDAINAAALAGTVVMLTPGPEPVGPTLGTLAPDGDGDDVVPVPAEPLLAGVLRVLVGDVIWTIDVTAARFVRSDRELDVRFLVEADWTPYAALWMTPTTIVAATTSGSFVIGRRSAATSGAGRPAAPAIA